MLPDVGAGLSVCRPKSNCRCLKLDLASITPPSPAFRPPPRLELAGAGRDGRADPSPAVRPLDTSPGQSGGREGGREEEARRRGGEEGARRGFGTKGFRFLIRGERKVGEL